MGQVDRTAMIMGKRVRATLAQINAGLTLLPATPGMAYRIVAFTMVAVGGAAGGATSVDIIATRAAASVRPFVVAVAALTQSAIVGQTSANVTALADGASHTAFDVNTGVTIGTQSGGSALTTLTAVDVILHYCAERA